jgi:hypothetical protein
MMSSILSKARDEAYRAGWSQAMQVNTDDAFAKGQEAARAEAPSRFNWLAVGMIIGGTLTGWFG